MAHGNLSRRQFVGATAATAVAGSALTRAGSAHADLQRINAQMFAGKTVRVATNDAELGNGVDAQVAAFQAATGASIELIRIPAADLQSKITTDLSSGTGAFDVVIEPFITMQDHAAAGFLVPLDDRIAADPAIDTADFVPLLYDTMAKFEGQVYALPYKADAYIFFHRTDLFADPALQEAFAAQNGGATLKVPDTAEELVATARFFSQKFNPASPTEFGWNHMAESGTSANWIWASRLAALGGSYLTPDYQPNFDTDAGRRALEIAVQLNECCAPDVGSYGWDEANTAFLSGRVAMMEQWPGLSKLAETPEGFYGKSEVVGKTGYGVPAGVTINGETVKSSILGGWVAAISNFAKDQDLAYATIAFLTGKEGEPLKIASGNDPCRNSTYAVPEIAAANPLYPTLQACLQQARITADVSAPPVGFELQTVMGQSFNAAWIGDQPTDGLLTQIAGEWSDILKRSGLQ